MAHRTLRGKLIQLFVLSVIAAACGDGERDTTAGYRLDPTPNVGELSLPDASAGGTPMRLVADAGGLLILFLGFTNCPDVCPATMASIGFAVKRTEAPAVEVAMVTVDPERDTPELLAAYVRQFAPAGHALRPANKQALDELAASIGVQYEVEDHGNHTADPENVEVGHTSLAYVIDDTGTVALVWTPNITADDMERDLEVLSDRLYGT